MLLLPSLQRILKYYRVDQQQRVIVSPFHSVLFKDLLD